MKSIYLILIFALCVVNCEKQRETFICKEAIVTDTKSSLPHKDSVTTGSLFYSTQDSSYLIKSDTGYFIIDFSEVVINDSNKVKADFTWLGGINKKPSIPKINDALYLKNAGVCALWNGKRNYISQSGTYFTVHDSAVIVPLARAKR